MFKFCCAFHFQTNNYTMYLSVTCMTLLRPFVIFKKFCLMTIYNVYINVTVFLFLFFSWLLVLLGGSYLEVGDERCTHMVVEENLVKELPFPPAKKLFVVKQEVSFVFGVHFSVTSADKLVWRVIQDIVTLQSNWYTLRFCSEGDRRRMFSVLNRMPNDRLTKIPFKLNLNRRSLSLSVCVFREVAQ